jgi:hypothetical protein
MSRELEGQIMHTYNLLNNAGWIIFTEIEEIKYWEDNGTELSNKVTNLKFLWR